MVGGNNVMRAGSVGGIEFDLRTLLSASNSVVGSAGGGCGVVGGDNAMRVGSVVGIEFDLGKLLCPESWWCT